jgi:hypothetical protein
MRKWLVIGGVYAAILVLLAGYGIGEALLWAVGMCLVWYLGTRMWRLIRLDRGRVQ